jgi:nicotinate-nucleotide adenylyltransferase
MNRRYRIGLLGGTFDPIHIAHLHVAACAIYELHLDEVRFLPAGSPPHKPHHPVSDSVHRLRMIEIAIGDQPAFLPDPTDLGAEGPSYTSDLLTRVQAANHGSELWFILGADSLVDFHTWHEPETILDVARLAVAERPGWDLSVVLQTPAFLPELSAQVDRFRSVPIDLSATLLRARIAAGKPVDWLLPPGVLSYIRRHRLYRQE